MSGLDLDALKRLEGEWLSEGEGPLVTRACWNEVRRQLPVIIATLERSERLWRCGSGHVVEVEAGTPPYEMGSCPICGALERGRRIETAARAVFGPGDVVALNGALWDALESKP